MIAATYNVTAQFAASGAVPVAAFVTRDVDTAIAHGRAGGNASAPPEYEYPTLQVRVTLCFPFEVVLWGVTPAGAALSLELERAARDDDGCDLTLALELPAGETEWEVTRAVGSKIGLTVTVTERECCGYTPACYERCVV